MTPARSRLIFLLIFLAAAALIGGGAYLQHVKHLEPCAMCILQRYAFVAAGLVALVGGVHGRWARTYGAGVLVVSLAGGGLAARQAWMQRFPSPEVECGPGLDYLLQSFPMSDALPMIFKGGGDCSKVQWTFLGGTIPEWALVWFVIFALAAVWVMAARRAR